MANKTIQTAYGSTTTVLGTGLNSLANATLSANGTTLNNGTALDLFADLVITLAAQGATRTTGGTFEIYMFIAADGTNYDTSLRGGGTLVASWVPDGAASAGTAARQTTITNVWIPPSATVQFAAYNNTGQALAASGNSVVAYPHSLNNNG